MSAAPLEIHFLVPVAIRKNVSFKKIPTGFITWVPDSHDASRIANFKGRFISGQVDGRSSFSCVITSDTDLQKTAESEETVRLLTLERSPLSGQHWMLSTSTGTAKHLHLRSEDFANHQRFCALIQHFVATGELIMPAAESGVLPQGDSPGDAAMPPQAVAIQKSDNRFVRLLRKLLRDPAMYLLDSRQRYLQLAGARIARFRSDPIAVQHTASIFYGERWNIPGSLSPEFTIVPRQGLRFHTTAGLRWMASSAEAAFSITSSNGVPAGCYEAVLDLRITGAPFRPRLVCVHGERRVSCKTSHQARRKRKRTLRFLVQEDCEEVLFYPFAVATGFRLRICSLERLSGITGSVFKDTDEEQDDNAETRIGRDEYERWRARYDRCGWWERHRLVSRLKNETSQPVVQILIMAGEDAAVQSSLHSLMQMRGINIRASVCDSQTGIAGHHARYSPGALVNEAIDPEATYLMLLAPGCRLHWTGLASLLLHAARTEAPLVYGDHDHLDPDGRRSRPWFKPGWDPLLFATMDYLGSACLARVGVVPTELRMPDSPETRHDLYGAMIDNCADSRIEHVPGIVCTSLKEAGIRHDPLRLEMNGELDGHSKRLPSVSIIVPTRDGVLLQDCLEGVLERTEYADVEVLVVDNQSCKSETHRYLDSLAGDPRVRVLRYDATFNYSAMNNLAALEARGEVLALLNDDVTVIEPDWLSQLVRCVELPGTGAVGARLLYPDGRIQHAGVVLGVIGLAGHAFRFEPGEANGYMNKLRTIHRVSAVTGACLAVKRQHYLEAGGLNEERLTVAFNDVDFCLRLQEAGYHNLMNPHACLYHHESLSRGFEDSPEKILRSQAEESFMRHRWSALLQNDPYYNPNLTVSAEQFQLSWPPRHSPVWKKQ